MGKSFERNEFFQRNMSGHLLRVTEATLEIYGCWSGKSLKLRPWQREMANQLVRAIRQQEVCLWHSCCVFMLWLGGGSDLTMCESLGSQAAGLLFLSSVSSWRLASVVSFCLQSYVQLQPDTMVMDSGEYPWRSRWSKSVCYIHFQKLVWKCVGILCKCVLLFCQSDLDQIECITV